MTRTNSTITVTLAFITLTAPNAAHAQAAGAGLLEGLTASPAASHHTESGPAPAEAKAVDGVPGLSYGHVSTTFGRASRGSSMKPGYVILKSGQRLEGEISIKVRAERGETGWYFHELEYRIAKGDKKQMFEAAYVHDFGLNYTIQDHTNGGKSMSKDPSANFHEAILRTIDGKEIKGQAAMVGSTIGGYSGVYYASSPTANLENLPPRELLEVVQLRGGAEQVFISYNGGLQPAMRGTNFVLFQNPRPTTRDTSWKAGFATMGARAASTVIAGAAAAKAEQDENRRLQKRVDAGDYLPAVVDDARATAARLEQGRQDAQEVVDNIDLGLMKTEYVIRNVKTGYEIFVHDGNLEAEVTPLLAACSATARMDKKQRKELIKFKNIHQLLETLDKCF